MLDKEIEEAINRQINEELESAYIYLSMASYFDSEALGGFASWMKVQVKEELSHMEIFYNYINARGGRSSFYNIKNPDPYWKTPLEAFQNTYEHEQHITDKINDLLKLAKSKNDNATEIMLQWFVTEQIEEENNALNILTKLKLIKDNPQGLLMLDKELSARVFIPPAGKTE